MLGKDRYKTTSGFFVNPLLSQLWEEKNYCERRNELSSWRPVALPNHHKHLCLFKLWYDAHALLSSVLYILSGKKVTAVYPMSRHRWDQNTTQVANRLNRARATYVWLLHISSMLWVLVRPQEPSRSPSVEERLYCERPIQCLASSKILTFHPLTARRVCTPPPAFEAGEDTLAGSRGGGGSIFWKTPDTALYSTYVSTLCLQPILGYSTPLIRDQCNCFWEQQLFVQHFIIYVGVYLKKIFLAICSV